ncbi:hypothetical protein BG000_010387 [Podila horticola]|nr:hypothetical protein BG000_010387 [Podila horticola]
MIIVNYRQDALEKCLEVLPLLKEFEIARGGVIDSTFLAMERHFGTLERLDMVGTRLRSWMVQRLTYLEIGVKRIKHVADRRLEFSLESEMDALLHLENLEMLDISPAKPSWYESQPADRAWLRRNVKWAKILE